MKKIFLSLIFTGLIAITLGGVISPVVAADDDEEPTKPTTLEAPLEKCDIREGGVGISGCDDPCVFASNPKCGICCLLNALYGITDWIFVVLIALAGIFVILGAMNILTSGGDPSKVSSGRQYIMYAMIGLLLAFLARAIPGIVRLIVGAS